jgi:hypothetical protein
MDRGCPRKLRWATAASFALSWMRGEVFKRDDPPGLFDDPARSRDSLPLPAEVDDHAR